MERKHTQAEHQCLFQSTECWTISDNLPQTFRGFFNAFIFIFSRLKFENIIFFWYFMMILIFCYIIWWYASNLYSFYSSWLGSLGKGSSMIIYNLRLSYQGNWIHKWLFMMVVFLFWRLKAQSSFFCARMWFISEKNLVYRLELTLILKCLAAPPDPKLLTKLTF